MLRARLEHTREEELETARARARRDRARPLGTSVIFVDAYLVDWLDLLIRWLHVVAAIVWIGTSFYFVALDSHLLPPRKATRLRRGRRRRVVGDPRRRLLPHPQVPRRAGDDSRAAALVQVGGVHDVAERLRAARRPLLPRRRRVPGRPRRCEISARARRSRSALRCSRVAWLVYDVLCRLLGNRELLLAAALVAFVAASAYAVSELFSARAAADPGRRDARDDDGRQRPLRDHPGPLGARAREAAPAASPTRCTGSRASSARCTTTT